jgi:hypothetical protein
MSRTHAHRPYYAWLAEPDVCRPTHDHRHGPCDLPSLDAYLAATKAVRFSAFKRYRCHWDIDLSRVPPLCGCHLCTDHYYRLWERRRDRHQTRIRLAKEY